MDREVWKDIKGLEEIYQASNMGNIRSKDRVIKDSSGRVRKLRGKLKSQSFNKKLGYLTTFIKADNFNRPYKTHQLIAMAFLDHIPNGCSTIVDHIDNNPLNNKLDNLQLITVRENSSKDSVNKTGFIGVQKHKSGNYQAKINIKGKLASLGTFNTPEEASEAYQLKLKEL